jgi:hypothetical protein
MDSQLVASSVNGVPVRLTPERWGHISRRHPEVAGLQNAILETVARPETVYEGDAGTFLAIRREDGLYLVVVYREVAASDGFIITAYLTRRIRGGRLAWKR